MSTKERWLGRSLGGVKPSDGDPVLLSVEPLYMGSAHMLVTGTNVLWSHRKLGP